MYIIIYLIILLARDMTVEHPYFVRHNHTVVLHPLVYLEQPSDTGMGDYQLVVAW